MENSEHLPDNYERRSSPDELDKLIHASGFIETELLAQLREGMVEIYDPAHLDDFKQLYWYYRELGQEEIERRLKGQKEEISDAKANWLAQQGLELAVARILRDCGDIDVYAAALESAADLADGFRHEESVRIIYTLLEEL